MSDWSFDDLSHDVVGGLSQDDLDLYREMALEHSYGDDLVNGSGDSVNRLQPRLAPRVPLQATQDREMAADNHVFGYDTPFFATLDTTPASNNARDQEFATFEDSETDKSMAPATGRRRRTRTVDLTSAATPADASTPRTRKRPADDSDAGEGPATKRPPKRTRSMFKPEDMEEVDLTEEAPSAEDELRQAQHQEAIRSQQAAEDSAGPQKIGRRQCIICMESYKNCTATSCGHFYCHECLVRALMAAAKSSGRGAGTCPVCRKPLSHTSKKKADVIPMSFMTKAEFDRQMRKGAA